MAKAKNQSQLNAGVPRVKARIRVITVSANLRTRPTNTARLQTLFHTVPAGSPRFRSGQGVHTGKAVVSGAPRVGWPAMHPEIPPRLRPGDTVAVLSPASPQKPGDEGLVQSGVGLLESWGLCVRGPEPFRPATLPYLAGGDDERASAFERPWLDDGVKAVFVTRGGYGSGRLLSRLQPGLLGDRRKIVAGFSDLTCLLLYLMKSCSTVVYHGPGIATRQFTEDAETREDLRRHLFEEDYQPALPLSPLRGGLSEGLLTGGCLSLVVSTLGTPWEIDTRDAILFLEDTGEALYRVDRMLTHLRNAGKLRGVRGVVFGEMSGLGSAAPFNVFLEDFFSEDRFPVAFGLPCGHGRVNLTLPFGRGAILDAGAGLLRIKAAGR